MAVLEIYDGLLRILGWILAFGIGVGAVSSSLVALMAPFYFLGAGFFRRLLALIIAGPLWGIWLFTIWRIARFTGGYVGSSEYPLQHVVRLISRSLG